MNRPSYLLFKKCSKCGEILHVSRFYKVKNGKYGVEGACKECRKIHNKKYREEHKDYYEEYGKQYYEDNKEYIKECSKQYYEDNKDKVLEYHKEYYDNNKDKVLEKNKQWREDNKDKVSECIKQWHKNNPQATFNSNSRRRTKEENQGSGINEKQWKEMMDFFNWTCAYSGEYLGGNNKDKKRTIDHIVALDNGGEHEIWNCVPMLKSYNTSKHTNNMLEWYLQQEYFDINRLTKIYEWRIYAYWKWKNEI